MVLDQCWWCKIWAWIIIILITTIIIKDNFPWWMNNKNAPPFSRSVGVCFAFSSLRIFIQEKAAVIQHVFSHWLVCDIVLVFVYQNTVAIRMLSHISFTSLCCLCLYASVFENVLPFICGNLLAILRIWFLATSLCF